MTNFPLWHSLVKRGWASIEEISAGWQRETPAQIAGQRLRADSLPRRAAAQVPQSEATQRILYSHLMARGHGTEVTILSALKGRASTPHDVTFLLPALLVRARSTGQPPTSSASSILSSVGGLVIATDKTECIRDNGIGQAPDPALKGRVCPLSIKYRVLIVEGDNYSYLPNVFETGEEADTAGRSWCRAWDDQHRGKPPDHVGAAYDVEQVWCAKDH